MEAESTVGWELGIWEAYIGPHDGTLTHGRYYLVHNGQLLRAVKPQYSKAPPEPGNLIEDSAFLGMLPREDNYHLPESQLALSRVNLLFERAGLTTPGLPPAPEYYNQKFKYLEKGDWDELRRRETQW